MLPRCTDITIISDNFIVLFDTLMKRGFQKNITPERGCSNVEMEIIHFKTKGVIQN